MFGFRHFPLRDIHPDAERAAEAAEAAAAQGAFWQMHDRMYESGGALSREDLIGYAAELGLDSDRVGAELDSAAHTARACSETSTAASQAASPARPDSSSAAACTWRLIRRRSR